MDLFNAVELTEAFLNVNLISDIPATLNMGVRFAIKFSLKRST